MQIKITIAYYFIMAKIITKKDRSKYWYSVQTEFLHTAVGSTSTITLKTASNC